ncbi:MAG: ABC transporter ATP-binding protein [Ruminococcus sp.]|nr:ABC transporter ATP-binding protein [Ruminococcus sp.]
MRGIEIKNITKDYGKTRALDNVSVNIEYGRIYGLLGRNGAGKSTLVNIISNRIFATEGEVLIDGEPAKENDKALAKLFTMSESNLLPQDMKVKEAISLTKEFYPDMNTEYAVELAKEFGLDLKKKLSSLSTGYSTITKDILALACNADYVIFDEPVLGLDANHRELFYKKLIERYSDYGGTFIVSTHLIDECASLIERAVIIDSGKLLLDSDTEEILAGAYTVTGAAAAVDAYAAGKEIIGSDSVGGLKSVYIKGRPENVPAGLEVSKASLQTLFIRLTNTDAENNA